MAAWVMENTKINQKIIIHAVAITRYYCWCFACYDACIVTTETLLNHCCHMPTPIEISSSLLLTKKLILKTTLFSFVYMWHRNRQVKSGRHAVHSGPSWSLRVFDTYVLTSCSIHHSAQVLPACICINAPECTRSYSKSILRRIMPHNMNCSCNSTCDTVLCCFAKQGMIPPHALIPFPIHYGTSKQNLTHETDCSCRSDMKQREAVSVW